MPHFGIIICLLEERIRSNICEILWPRLMGTGIKLQSIQGRSQYVVSDRNKHFKFDLDRKPNLQLKIEPTFLAWLPKGKIEKTTEYLLFSIFIQFSAIEIRWVLSHAKLLIHVSWLLCLEKKVGCLCSLVSYSHFFTDRAQYQSKSTMFSICSCLGLR